MPEHPLVRALAPLVERLDAELVDPADARPDDVTLAWEGAPVVAVRLPSKPADGGVQSLLAEVAAELGGPLRDLSRHDKQRAVLLLEERGAFEYRKSAETVAEALGVTRFTVYNYLNRSR
ncbi:helix-turn-helix domain-containing protein [Kribbella sp. NPDC048915]|uniref:helix-turn-helix domain-containing protein n=1 Tax=Kribbella sp. NPDC048915 TaxID=3155148 RepID=UPI00340A4D59